jgi:hypothetical protein
MPPKPSTRVPAQQGITIGFMDVISRSESNLARSMAEGLGYQDIGGKLYSPSQIIKNRKAFGKMAVLGAIAEPLGILRGAYEGFKEDGLAGVPLGAVKGYGWNVASNFAMNALRRGGAAAMANPMAAVGVALSALPFVAAAGILYGGVKGATTIMEKSWQTHVNKIPLQFAGSTAAFFSDGAATMRQRSVMAIQRSHLNARSAFGQEASYLHIAKYRGMRR